ncbi:MULTISPECIES: glycosyltransferase family 8 protein [Thioclava]|uniref:glycosyltransferase family 8 protein n=1 Tax=Thioclava TaxID=285107 RepID=UPI000C3857B5|nr:MULTISPECIES: glycosyltransferase family 8 protein [Thioclava]MAQ38108.1 hypothetical protein [Thioclava sp.]|tara:strand:- start:393 stop:1280 length:888 start_codon:yes stop_codon:yes gene_type:complete
MTFSVAYVFDTGFERCTLVSLHSLLTHASCPLEIALFSETPSAEFSRRIAALEKVFPGSTMTLRPLPGAARGAATRGHISAATMGRLFLPEVMTGRVLYIDGDTLVRHDIAPLGQADLEGRPLGACRAPRMHGAWLTTQEPHRVLWPRPFRQRVAAAQAIPGLDPGQYVNAGVLLMDMESIQAEGFVQPMADWRQAETYTQRDQDHLNIVFRDRITFLAPEWNSIWGNMRTARRPFRAAERAAYAISRDDPAILHYTGKRKPWGGDTRARKTRERRWGAEWCAAEARMLSQLDSI